MSKESCSVDEPRNAGGESARRLTRRALFAEAVAAGTGAAVLGGLNAQSALAAPPGVVQTFPIGQAPTNPITKRVYSDPRVIWTVEDTASTGRALVMAVKDELLVRATALSHPAFVARLKQFAVPVASLKASILGKKGDDKNVLPPTKADLGRLEDTQLWRLIHPSQNSIQVANILNTGAPSLPSAHTRTAGLIAAPAVSPNHVFVACRGFDSCPAGPPKPLPSPPVGSTLGTADFIPARQTPAVRVVVIDSGYILSQGAPLAANPAHTRLDLAVTSSVGGYWFDTASHSWELCATDEPLKIPNHPNVLDGVAGHGTFIAGQIAHLCPNALLTVVGERRAIIQLTGAPLRTVYSDEYSVARSLLRYGAGADVVSCGFAFPTLGRLSSIPFTSVMGLMAFIDSANRKIAAVVAPAGNQGSGRPYWPAAHPDVIGVGAINSATPTPAAGRASFSNWGPWLKCCAPGVNIGSVFIDWKGAVEDGRPQQTFTFDGWATWLGTSFAAPQVTARIASLVATGMRPVAAFPQLVMSSPRVPGTAAGGQFASLPLLPVP